MGSHSFRGTVNSLVRRKWYRYIKVIVVVNEKIAVQITSKVDCHGKAFALYNNKGVDLGIVGKLSSSLRVFRV